MSITPIPMNRFWRADSWEAPTGDEIRMVMDVAKLSSVDAAALVGLSAQNPMWKEWLGGASPIRYSAWAVLCTRAGLGSIENFGPAPVLTLKDMFPPIEKKERRVYGNFEVTTTCDPVANIIEINLALLNGALKGDGIWAMSLAERNHETFRPDRYVRAHEEFRLGRAVYMPYLSFNRGRTRIVDGRHRLYALIDLGYTHCPVVVDSSHVETITTLAQVEP